RPPRAGDGLQDAARVPRGGTDEPAARPAALARDRMALRAGRPDPDGGLPALARHGWRRAVVARAAHPAAPRARRPDRLPGPDVHTALLALAGEHRAQCRG